MKKKIGAYVLLNKPKSRNEFNYTFFDTLLSAALEMHKFANQANPDKNIYILKHSDYLIFKRHLEEDTTETYKECFKIKPIEVEDLDNIFDRYKLDLL